ncbi:hypothetical protein CAPTEDRAFT_224754 [Capitella teleta]|uniref:Peroxin-19 n=1 Tax=Capitella teleta TaxID=283909 RepID=R7TFK6_CAPTE|nr:hypothetical protein CAPTEDRAFT_224754 [Capitella teleta]|eukprot:ELT92282.1 hypothetical protein CAPTEDRAFT_224754 [Capitella teleta]
MEDANKLSVQDDDKSTSTSEVKVATEDVEYASDPELEDLLESALGDFDKKAPPVAEAAANGPSNSTIAPPNKRDSLDDDAMFNDIFTGALENHPDMEQLMKTVMDGMGSGQADSDDFLKQFEKFAHGTTTGVPGTTPESHREFSETLKETLGSLAQNAEELQNDVSEDEILKMMSQMGLGTGGAGGGGGGGEMDFMPVMENMMKSLLSKDVLYPSLKDITSKYPTWLSENKEKISSEEYSKYAKQNDLMGEIVREFDEEKDADSDESKRLRFDRIMNVMQQMQELGQPPKEIVGDMPPGLDLDPNGLPKFPGAEQCSIM